MNKTHCRQIGGLSEIAENYDAVLCDVWGVLHNGKQYWPEAASALAAFRNNGGVVVMITNAPRPREPVLLQLQGLGVPDGVFDDVVTSGDVTRQLVSEVDGPVFHLGPERDYTLYAGLEVSFAKPEEATAIVCTGLFDDRSETPEDYVELLERLNKLQLPMICANPDLVVEYGDRLLWCAGALARDYAAIGGKTRIVGKPHKPIYEHVTERISKFLGFSPEKSRLLAIGDCLQTDIAGAQNFDLDALFISGGIHAAEYGGSRDGTESELQRVLDQNNAKPIAWMPELVW